MLLQNGNIYYYITNAQGDVIRLVDINGNVAASYRYDPYGKAISALGSHATINPLRYRGYVYDVETGLYYLQSRYYDPEIGRFINADALVSTGQGLLGNNMFAYCGNNPIMYVDNSGLAPCHVKTCLVDDGGGYGPNIDFLKAFYGVQSQKAVPEKPEGSMYFVENITSITVHAGITIIEGRTVVFDEYKYCEYSFVGVGYSVSMSIPLDMVITQGYVYGINNVNDYCGFFLGASANMLATCYGGAWANPEVYAETVGGMSYAPSLGASVTLYTTNQTSWIYGKANLSPVVNPYQYQFSNEPIAL